MTQGLREAENSGLIPRTHMTAYNCNSSCRGSSVLFCSVGSCMHVEYKLSQTFTLKTKQNRKRLRCGICAVVSHFRGKKREISLFWPSCSRKIFDICYLQLLQSVYNPGKSGSKDHSSSLLLLATVLCSPLADIKKFLVLFSVLLCTWCRQQYSVWLLCPEGTLS